VHVQRGDSIVFKNDDFLPHTATALPAGGFDSGMIKPGESRTLADPVLESTHYHCTYHPTMEGEIVVD
jgi:plastocyanin